MLLCLDVQYEDLGAVAACVGFRDWADASPCLELVSRSDAAPAPYQPGQFARRELPHLVRLVEEVRRAQQVEAVVVDGHVWLQAGRPGLGAHLHQALGGGTAVVGVAKSAFRDGVALPVLRGASRQPLFVTAAGMEPALAAELVRGMHGPHRIPTLLKRADRLARGRQRPSPALTPPPSHG